MANLTLFGYRHGHSDLHQLDPRLKFFMICLISLCMVKSGFYSSLFYFVILIFWFKITRISILDTIKGLGPFFILLFFVFIARAFSETGENLLAYYIISITRQGIVSGGSIAFKFFLIMLTGLIFSTTTSLSDVKNSIQWYLKPIPFVPEKRLSVMIGLSLGFIPLIFKLARQISDARRARCGDQIKNPIKKIIGLVLPLLKKIFTSADHIILAMESRAYTDDRTPPIFHPSGNESVFFICTLFIAMGLLFF